MSQLTEALNQLTVSLHQLSVLLTGDENASVVIDGEIRDSLKKTIKDNFSAFQAAMVGHVTFASKATMDADLNHPADTIAEVWNDAAPDNNGIYGKVGASGSGSWTKSPLDFLKSAYDRIDARINEREILDGHKFAIVDANGYAVALIDKNGDVRFTESYSGTHHADILNSKDLGSDSYRQKETAVIGFEYAIIDANGFICFGVTKTGEIYAPEMTGGVAGQWQTLDLNNADTIVNIGDSHTASHYTIKNKAYISNLSALSEYRHQNFGVSGNDALDMAYRITMDSAYVDGKTFADINAKYAFICSHDNDAQFTGANLEYWQQNMERLLEVVQGAGSQPVVCTEFNSTRDEWLLLREVANKFDVPFVDNASINHELGTLDVGPFFQGHPGTRTNGVLWLCMHQQVQQLPRPDKGIKIFRKREGFAAATVDDLLTDNLHDRYNKFQELALTHYALTDATVQHYDELDGANVSSHQVISDEYWQLQQGNSVSFSDYALVECIVPGTAKSLDALKLKLQLDAGCTVYVRDWLSQPDVMPGKAQGTTPTSPDYLDEWNKPVGGWRQINLLNDEYLVTGADLEGLLQFDKLAVLVYKSGGFALNGVELQYKGQGGKPAQFNPQYHAVGAELLPQPSVAQADLAGWTVTGSPASVVPLDAANAPRKPSDNAQPVADVLVLNAAATLRQVLTLPAAGRKYRITVWARNFPKAFLDNSSYSLDAAQVIDRSGAGITYANDSLINDTTADLKRLRCEVALAAAQPSVGGVIYEDFACLTWRPICFDVEVPPAPLGGTDLVFTLSSPDGELQIAKVSVKELSA